MTARLDAWCMDAARRVDIYVRDDMTYANGNAAEFAQMRAMIEAEACPWVRDRRRWPTLFRAAPFAANVRATHLHRDPDDERGAAITVAALMILRHVETARFLISDREPNGVSK
jgi:hypothetical protein